MHPNTTVIVDEAAAAKLKRADYYKNVAKLATKVDSYLANARARYNAN